MSQRIVWTYDQTDPALMLWTAALKAWDMRLPFGARVLELGCAETDFLERLQAQNPSYQLTGLDCFPQERQNVVVGDACDETLFRDEAFDAVIMLGALEHFGLGFYGDPIHEFQGDPIGDILAMQNVARWLKKGGWVYFDVPCNPNGGIKENRHFRVYSPGEVGPRLLFDGLREVHRGYSMPEPHAGTWINEPTTDMVPYHFVAIVAEKA